MPCSLIYKQGFLRISNLWEKFKQPICYPSFVSNIWFLHGEYNIGISLPHEIHSRQVFSRYHSNRKYSSNNNLPFLLHGSFLIFMRFYSIHPTFENLLQGGHWKILGKRVGKSILHARRTVQKLQLHLKYKEEIKLICLISILQKKKKKKEKRMPS